MRTGVTVQLNPTDRKRLQAIIDGRNSPQKHVWRAMIVVGTADGLGTAAIMRTAGVSKTAVWRWQERFMSEGVDGLLRDKTRPARLPKIAEATTQRVVALTLSSPPGESTHWTGRMMAKVAGISLTSVQRIWKTHGLGEGLVADPPHRHRLQYEESTWHLRGRRVSRRQAGRSLWSPKLHQKPRFTNDVLD